MALIIFADDLTGAMDTGVKFSRSRSPVIVLSDLSSLELKNNGVYVLNTNTRNLGKESAYLVLKAILKNIKNSNKIIYKKIDSTMRGNVGSEIKAFIEETDINNVFICSANPSQGRLIKDGILFLEGVKVEDTSSGKDSLKGINTSEVIEIISSQIDMPVYHVIEEKIKYFSLNLQEFNQILKEFSIISFDATTEKSLFSIVDLSTKINRKVLLCGSAGLAEAYSKKFANDSKNLAIISGSLHKRSREQLKYLISTRKDITWIKMNPEDPEPYAKQLLQGLSYGSLCLLTVDCSKLFQSEIVERAFQKIGKELGNLENMGLILNGGDTAFNVLAGMGQRKIFIDKEIINGCVQGWVKNKNMIITKSGGFGSKETLVEILKNIGR